MLSRIKSARYISAALAAVTIVSTLYYIQLPSGFHPTERFAPWNFPPRPWQQSVATSDPLWDARAAQVKEAYRHAYRGYMQYAAGFDELRPLAKQGVNNFNGWNVTMYDSLDTMLLMGLYDEFAGALPIVETGDFRHIKSTKYDGATTLYVPFFETVIRYLGGLLSAYALSGEKVLLDKADLLANLLEPAFKTPRGFPVFGINTANFLTSGGSSGILAEIASCQLEWTYLAHATNSRQHYNTANRVIEGLAEAMSERKGGMFPTFWNLGHGIPISEARSVGAAADSAHEYLLKQHLLTGQTDIANLEMYLLTTNEVLTRLMYVTPERDLLYVTDTGGPKFTPTHNFEHLACFFPGLLALGAHTLPLNLSVIDPSLLSAEAQRQYRLLENYDLRALHMAAAEGLATSCWLLYADMPTGLGPEIVTMPTESRPWIEVLEEWRVGGMRGPMPGLGEKQPIPYQKPFTRMQPWDYRVKRAEYYLRPETLESIYIMWRVTGDPVWRERGWAIFQAIEKETKLPVGYASLKAVDETPGPHLDDQPSYFLAETLKYLYLMFINDDPVPLDKWVFNTEAHPLPMFQWNSWEKHKFDVPV